MMNGNTVRGLLANNIKRRRAALGLSQETLAEEAGISTSFLSAIETGRKWPYPETLASLAAALGLTVGHFFVEEGDVSLIIGRVCGKAEEALGKLQALNDGLEALRQKSQPPDSGALL